MQPVTSPLPAGMGGAAPVPTPSVLRSRCLSGICRAATRHVRPIHVASCCRNSLCWHPYATRPALSNPRSRLSRLQSRSNGDTSEDSLAWPTADPTAPSSSSSSQAENPGSVPGAPTPSSTSSRPMVDLLSGSSSSSGSSTIGTAANLLFKAVGAAVMFTGISAAGPRPAAASSSVPPVATVVTLQAQTSTSSSSSSTSRPQVPRWSAVPVADIAAAVASQPSAATSSTQVPERTEVAQAIRTDPDLQALISERKQKWYAARPGMTGSGAYEAALSRDLGVPLDFDEVMRSMVYAPGDVPTRLERHEIYTYVNAMLNQYDAEDFDLGIKQFMIEQEIERQMADGLDKKGDNKDFEEKLAEQLFADETIEKVQVRTADIEDDAFTTEKMEEANLLMGPATAVRTAWRVAEHLKELSYTQFWQLVSEGHVDTVRPYGVESRAALVHLKASAPGGARVSKVVLPPDPELLLHLVEHGVAVEQPNDEENRLTRAFLIQISRYTMPFVVISALFWLLHTWILDPTPNQFRRREFIRYRREILHVSSKLNFRTPARQVFIDTNSPDFIAWDDINGIDEVKAEIQEIIDYLKDPALLRLRGVARIGGVMLAGSPGTGKTLLAKAIAAESGVRMFTCSGTDFYDVYTGVGARRIRETFETIRNFAPAILFVDEFDALGAARGGSAQGDESASIINELLVQMDGFEDNRGIVVLGATNRPGAIDAALIRPGRFDRIIYMPLPDVEGRSKIMQVHARNKAVEPNINWLEVSRAMAGFTGADCMGLMARAARMAARAGREAIGEEDIYAAMENKAMEAFQEQTDAPLPGDSNYPDPIPHRMRKSITVYEAAKAVIAYITPEFDDIARISICPYNILTGYTLFVEDEGARADALLTRGDMEANMVVALAGRCGEKLVMGEGEVTGIGTQDVFHANMIAREMVLSAGFNRKMGPVDLLQLIDDSEPRSGDLLRSLESKDPSDQDMHYYATDMPIEQARVALSEVLELLEGAEAKAYYGLAINWKPFQALVEALLDRGVLQGAEVAHILESNGIVHFPDTYIEGFGWDEDGGLNYPFRPERTGKRQPEQQAAAVDGKEPVLAGVAAKTMWAGTDQDPPRGPDGKYDLGWHWNMPYTIKRDWPDWYRKEFQRYSY